ncbi:15777_t:CDS:2 [Dentiscutata erythropus]|uniref:15777_t:CDS:1 n=1 Tax=Dentiscutata erythropus TaxID=1348616 RepID=A0A9N9F567_9GLOM|nr:15777_t:CDS:2 [Dentiscutata erythropus]
MDKFLKIYLSCLLVLIVGAGYSLAVPSPTEPVGATVWTAGQNVTALWADNGVAPKSSSMSGITVQFMTGPNSPQIPLQTLAAKLDNTATSLSFICPAPSSFGYPPGQIYFLMFSDSANPSIGVSWSTRFTVLEPSNSSPPANYTVGAPWTFTKSSTTPTTPAPAIAPTTAQPVVVTPTAQPPPPAAAGSPNSPAPQPATIVDTGDTSAPTDTPPEKPQSQTSATPAVTSKKTSGTDSKFQKSNGKFLAIVMGFVCAFSAFGM